MSVLGAKNKNNSYMTNRMPEMYKIRSEFYNFVNLNVYFVG